MLSVAVVASLVAMLAIGIGNALTKRPAVELGAIETIVWRNIVAVVVLGAVFFAVGAPVDFSRGSIIVGFLIAFAGYFPFMFFMYGLERGKVGVVTAVSKTRIAVSSVFGFLILGDVFSLEKAAAVVIIFLGILVATVDFKDFRNSELFSWKSGVPLALIAALLWGIVLPLFKFPSEWYGALFWAFVIELFVLVGGFVHLALLKRSLVTRDSAQAVLRNLPFLIGAGVLTAVFTFSINVGYETGEISLVSAISGAGVIIAVIASALLYGERLAVKQYLGAGFVVLGIILAAVL